MKAQYEQHARAVANEYGVDPDLVLRQIAAESNWNPAAVSNRGAVGLMQLMPATAASLGVDPRDPIQNIRGGVKYLAQQIKDFGDVTTGLAAYNWGPGNVRKLGLDKMPAETRQYIAKVQGMDDYSRFRPSANNAQDDVSSALESALSKALNGIVAPAPAPAATPSQPVKDDARPAQATASRPKDDVKAAPSRNDDVLRQGLEMGPVGNFMSGMIGRTAETSLGTMARAIEAVRGPQAAADFLKRIGAFRPTGFDPDSAAAKTGGFASDAYVGGKAAQLAGAGVTALGRSAQVANVLPGVGRVAEAVGNATSSMGAASGLPPGLANFLARTAGGAAGGAASAAVTDPENVALSAALGGTMPTVLNVAGAAGKAAGAVVRPFTQGGREQIAGQVLRESTQNPAQVAKTMSQPAKSFAPLTLAERTMDPGLASLQRTVMNNPVAGPDVTAFLNKQNQMRAGVLDTMTAHGALPSQLRAAREAATKSTYNTIAQNYGDDALNTVGVKTVANNIMATPRYRTEAVAREVLNAIEDNPGLGINRFGSQSSGEWRKTVPMRDMWGARQNIDQRLYGGSGLDAKASAEAAAGELSKLRNSMSTQLRKIPGFSAVEKLYADYSKKADAADVLVDLYKKATTGAADMFDNPIASGAKLTQALKQIDAEDWMKLSKDQRATIQQLAQELQRAATARDLGKATGSNTVQNALADSQLKALIQGAATMLPGGNYVRPLLGAGTDKAQEKVMGLLGGAITDPVEAARLASILPRQYLSPELQRALTRGVVAAPSGLLSLTSQ